MIALLYGFEFYLFLIILLDIVGADSITGRLVFAHSV